MTVMETVVYLFIVFPLKEKPHASLGYDMAHFFPHHILSKPTFESFLLLMFGFPNYRLWSTEGIV